MCGGGELAGHMAGRIGEGHLRCGGCCPLEGCRQRQADGISTVDACRLPRLCEKIWMLEEEIDLEKRAVGVSRWSEGTSPQACCKAVFSNFSKEQNLL